MIPEELTIKGFYSYKEEQKISFTRLFQDKMFGIFGNVGSGKSSILEAITLALYGETERLNQNDDRNYNIMNLSSNSLAITFIFRVNDKRYRFEVAGKRDPKEREKVILKYKHFREENKAWVSTKETATEILGLTYENFRRTIIIPQGKFQEFLTLSNKNRTEMLKELFFLHRFDLTEKTKKQAQNVLEKLKSIEGQLLEIGNPTEEEILSLEKNLSKLEEKILTLQEKQNELQKQLQEQELLKTSLQEIAKIEIRLSELHLQVGQINFLEKELSEWEVFRNIFLETYLNYKNSESKIQEIQLKIESAKEQLQKLKLLEPKIQANFEKNERRLKEKEKYLRKQEERLALLDFLKVQQEWNTLQNHLEEILKENSKIENQIQDIKKIFQAKKENLTFLREQQKDFEKLLERRNELSDRAKNLNDYKNLEIEKKFQEENLNNIQASFKEKLQSLMQMEDCNWNIATHIERIKKEIVQVQKELEAAQTFSSLKILSQRLKVGDICPLCGEMIQSKQHIEKNLQSQDRSNLLKIDLEKLLKLHNELQLLQQEQDLKTQIQLRTINEIEIRLQNLKLKLPTESELEELKTIETKLSLLKQNQIQISDLEAELNLLEQELNLRENELRQKIDKNLKFQTELSTLEGRMQTLKKNFSHDVFEKGKNFSLEKIKERIELQTEVLKRIPIEYDRAAKEKFDLDNKISLMQNLVFEREKERELEDSLYKEQRKKLENLFMQQKDFNLLKLEELSNKNFDAEEARKKIQSYYEEKKNLERKLKEEKEKISAIPNRLAELDILKKELLENTQNLEFSLRQQGNFLTNLERLKTQLQRKKELEIQKNLYQNKMERVQLLQKLFQGQGFVDYVSRIFLEDLCESANERFFIFTRNRLRLELNKEGEIQVRDYMNNGNLRHVKTLSGGQMFQASLSMALALSDRIQRNIDNNRSFFFLDEGFGSLDKDSLEVVFETLKTLRKENRIIGIISHVEEMKSAIRTFLWIENDPEFGSKIQIQTKNF